MRMPSDATMLRHVRSELRQSLAERAKIIEELGGYRHRATKAEQECAEWKARFDLLLSRAPEASSIVPAWGVTSISAPEVKR